MCRGRSCLGSCSRSVPSVLPHQVRFFALCVTSVLYSADNSNKDDGSWRNSEYSPELFSANDVRPLKEQEEESNLDWLKRQAILSVAQKKQSKASAEYLQKMVKDFPELLPCVQEARRLLNGNKPDQLTRFQQAQFTDRIAMYTSGVASKRLMQTRHEESAAKKFTQDGTPTGENYWMEAGNILASPSVPGYLKDDLLEDLQTEREASSPAYWKPTREQFSPSDEAQYAEHLRRQKRRLFDGLDKE